MSLRPRFGDGGLLRRPLGLDAAWEEDPRQEWDGGQIVGRLADDRDWDPFERTGSGLLLAESFARADLLELEAVSAWYLEHGAVDPRGFLPGEDWSPYRDPEPPSDWFYDGRGNVVEQQHRVAWLLLTLARLSQGPEAWDPHWMEIGLRREHDFLFLGRGDGDALGLSPQRTPEQGAPAEIIWVPAAQWDLGWSEIAEGREWDPDDHRVVPLGPDRDGLIEVVRRLIEPFAREAARFQVDVLWPGDDLPVVVRERRRWRSVLAPIYLQLLEGLRRVTEGQRGAGSCKECGEPFLTLDARRSSFCNDQHRFRFSQRERRRRVDLQRAAQEALALSDVATARVERPGSEEPPT